MRRPETTLHHYNRAGAFLIVSAAAWLLLLLPQSANALRLLSAKNLGISLLAAQEHNVLVALGFGALGALTAGSRSLRWLLFLLLTVHTLGVFAEHLHFSVFQSFFTLAAAESVQTIQPMLGWDSVVHAFTLPLGIAGLLQLAVLGFFGRWWLQIGGKQVMSTYTVRGPALVMTLALVVSIAAIRRLPQEPGWIALAQHPFAALIAEWWSGTLKVSGTTSDRSLTPLVQKADRDDRLPAVVEKLRHALPGKPNVLLVVLESVGALNLLGSDGKPDPSVTPVMARLGESAVSFPELSVVFPGTVRSHIAMQTGGRHLTQGNVYEMLSHAFKGPLIAGQFRDAGYRTGLFSSERLDGEAMEQFVDRAGYDIAHEFGRDLAGHVRKNVLNSWGSREEYTISRIEQWLDAQPRDSAPFFLTYLTVATHHPYSVPPGFPIRFPGDNDAARYRNALHYSDVALGQLLDGLKARGLLDNTIIVVTGDHGQAFGDIHRGNYTHKFFLYEENVRSFLLLSHPAIGESVVSRRVATSGDLFPTIANAAGLPLPKVPGLNLLQPELPARMVFFHKSALPELWGLRDGPWKFIQNIRSGAAELYDLANDPREQTNVASAHPDKVKHYGEACETWYIRQDEEFAGRLDGYQRRGGKALTVQELREPGPKRMAFGYPMPDNPNGFREATVIRAGEPPILWTSWVSVPQDRPVAFVWKSPGGVEKTQPQTISPEWATSRMPCPFPAPLERGEWKVSIEEAGRTLLESRFGVE